MLFLGHLIVSYVFASGIFITHIKFRNLAKLATFLHQLQHLDDMIFRIFLFVMISIARDMHLRCDTINLGNTISLPILDPLNQTLQLGIVVPIAIQVIIIDEEFQFLRVTIMGGKTLASCSYSSANIINVTQVILPVEIVLCIVS